MKSKEKTKKKLKLLRNKTLNVIKLINYKRKNENNNNLVRKLFL